MHKLNVLIISVEAKREVVYLMVDLLHLFVRPCATTQGCAPLVPMWASPAPNTQAQRERKTQEINHQIISM